MLSYVDNNNISNNGAPHDYTEDVFKQTQHDAQGWNDILNSIGGILNLLIYFFQVNSYKYSRVGAPVVAATDPLWYIDINDNNDNVIERVQKLCLHPLQKSRNNTGNLLKTK